MEAVIIEKLLLILPTLLTTMLVVGTLLIINYLVRRGVTGEISVSHQLLMLLLTGAGVLIIIFSLPLTEASRGQVLSLLGIVITAVIALSSTTFVANIMAGLMLRAVNSFRPGDFIRSSTFFGRVTERGIFHTEIQTEDRDLMTLPNMYLVNNPVTVVHESGTVISATLSLGYDVPHAQVEDLLRKAAEETGLLDAFTFVMELNDFSVTYRVGGFSDDVSRLLSIKSALRKNILTILHESGIEIVSPNFMNQRALSPGERMIPAAYISRQADKGDSSPEDVIFDKAEGAAEKEALIQEQATAKERLKALQEELKGRKEENATLLEQEKDQLLARVEEISRLISEPGDESEG